MAKKSPYNKLMKVRWTKNKSTSYLISIAIIAVLAFFVPKLTSNNNQNQTGDQANYPTAQITKTEKTSAEKLSKLTFKGQQTLPIDQNNPGFTKSELSLANGAWQKYGNLDNKNRVTIAKAMLHKSLMPTTERERLYVNPTGYHNKKIQIDDYSDWLYNRCHMIGFQLTGQNNNIKNLFTGTRSLNNPCMTTYENQIANYLKRTGNHVYYVIQPIFVDDELVARGVWLRAQSIEDNAIKFNVYIFNVQKNYQINYLTGTSQKES